MLPLALALALAPPALAEDPAPAAEPAPPEASASATLRRCGDPVVDMPKGAPDVMKRAVRIETVRGSGSGYVVSPDGFVLTAAHVVGKAERADVILADGERVEGTVVRASEAADLALLRVKGSDLPCLPLASGRAPVGDDVFVIGSPVGEALTNSLTRGIVSGYREVDGWTVLQTDASVSPGSSGGMVISGEGAALGVVSFKAVGLGIEGIAFAIASESVEKALGFTFGDTTSETIERRDGEGGAIAGKGSAKVTDRPAKPAPPYDHRRMCADVDVKDDPFNGGKRVVARGANEFDLTWESDGEARFTAKIGMYDPVAQSPRAMQPGGIELQLLLEDGSKVHLVSQQGRLGIGFGAAYLNVDFPLPLEVAEALASSPPVLQRWTGGGSSTDQERSERQREKYYRPMFACLYHHMAM